MEPGSPRYSPGRAEPLLEGLPRSIGQAKAKKRSRRPLDVPAAAAVTYVSSRWGSRSIARHYGAASSS